MLVRKEVFKAKSLYFVRYIVKSVLKTDIPLAFVKQTNKKLMGF